MPLEQADFDMLRALCNGLSDYHIDVIESRGRGETFESIGARYGVTKSAVKQTYDRTAKAIREARQRVEQASS